MLSPNSDFQSGVLKKPAKLPDLFESIDQGLARPIDQVGMAAVEAPLKLKTQAGETVLVPALVDVFVSLDQAEARGIHMSRLYRKVTETLVREPFSAKSAEQLVRALVDSQEGLSSSATLRVSYDLLTQRPALVSGNLGWRQYPVVFEVQLSKAGELRASLGVEVLYSSTCPCSAALARQLNQKKFLQAFLGRDQVSSEEVFTWLGTEESVGGLPHAQRSRALVKISGLLEQLSFEPLELVDKVESALKTPVQSFVKREDEQAFAQLNAENLMFCEDAARRIAAAMDPTSQFNIYVEHQESLHPHQAVAQIQSDESPKA